jgi:hypothetical protein
LAEWLWDDELPLDLRLDCIAAMPEIFRKLFVGRPLEQACYIWWDMLRHFGEGGDPRIVAAMVLALEQILPLPARHCRVSALHGLGHLEHPSKATVIETFLRTNPTIDLELRQYAEAAVVGKVL